MNKLMVDFPCDERRFYYTDKENCLVCECNNVCREIKENVKGAFDGSFDKNGNFCLAVSVENAIECFVDNKDKSYSFVLEKIDKGNISCIKLLCCNNMFSIWYCLERDGVFYLVNQSFDLNGNIQPPFSPDVLGMYKCYDVCCDKSGNTHIFYVDKDDKTRYLRCRNGHFVPQAADAFEVDYVTDISAVAYDEDVYIAYVAKRGDYSGIYCKKIGDTGKVLGFGSKNGCNVLINASDSAVTVYRSDADGISECVSRDDCSTFSKPMYIKELKGNENQIWRYKNASNPLSLYIKGCVVSDSGKRVLHEKEICGVKSENLFDAKSEYEKLRSNSMSEMNVNINIAASLESIERELMKIAYILESGFKEKSVNITDRGEIYEENVRLFENTDINSLGDEKNERIR